MAAELYKLLIYEPGGFFVSHRDTEKAPGMFATLVIVLPCAYEGGGLVVSHRGRTETLDLKPSDPGEAGFAAFFADPQPRKLVYLLQHVYTPAELGFSRLKGADAGVAAVLTAAATEAGCDLHLALLTIEEDGWAEVVDGGYGRRAGRDFGGRRGSVSPRRSRRPAPGRGILPRSHRQRRGLVRAQLSPGRPGAMRSAARAHLCARVAEPLAPPADWRREAKLGCGCADCQELARFLTDSAAPTWTLKAIQGRRSHVESTILNAKPDLHHLAQRQPAPTGLHQNPGQLSTPGRATPEGSCRPSRIGG